MAALGGPRTLTQGTARPWGRHRALESRWHGDSSPTHPGPAAPRGRGAGCAPQHRGDGEAATSPCRGTLGRGHPWHPGLVGEPIPRATLCLVLLGREQRPGKGLLWEGPAATGCQVPPQPSCEGPGAVFRDWRSSSEHQFCDRGGLSGGSNCKRNQKGKGAANGEAVGTGPRAPGQESKEPEQKRDQSKVWTRPKEKGKGVTK